mmetsp:Transcript_17522/g.37921  ORF Transcript_17522/g.37921 Transcript_17522/m.37921 type:complete len:168 (+) Transcript_17522:1057-1560(+)
MQALLGLDVDEPLTTDGAPYVYSLWTCRFLEEYCKWAISSKAGMWAISLSELLKAGVAVDEKVSSTLLVSLLSQLTRDVVEAVDVALVVAVEETAVGSVAVVVSSSVSASVNVVDDVTVGSSVAAVVTSAEVVDDVTVTPGASVVVTSVFTVEISTIDSTLFLALLL